MSDEKKISYEQRARKIGDALSAAQKSREELAIRKALKDAEVLRQVVMSKGSDQDKYRFLRWARSRAIIKREDEYLLNEMESSKLQDECEYVAKINGGIGTYLELGDKVKYSKQYNDDRGEDMFTFYVAVEKEPEERLSQVQARKFLRDGFLEDKDRPEGATQIHRFVLREKEFTKYFNV